VSRYHSYLNSAVAILRIYRGDEPLASFLKKYFAANKKYGSNDRKQISHLCYCFFRLGKAVADLAMEERILTGLFLCSTEPDEILQQFRPLWNERTNLNVGDKCSMLNVPPIVIGAIFNVFPWQDELSEGIDYKKFCESFFIQPDLFLRLRPGKEEIVKRKLRQAGIDFKNISETCLALPNNSKVDSVIELGKEAIIQDYHSQLTGGFFKSQIQNQKSAITLWDCCAGSGGKSIMAFDLNPHIELTVSDVRESILVNLKKRFNKAGIRNYKSFVADLTHDSRLMTHDSDIIIADVPCTGSGTWSRTPEQLYFFNHQTIKQFNHLQRKIISKVVPHLQPGGSLIYITCSVFKKENEEVVDFASQKFHLHLKKAELLNGYDKKADSMFVAVLEKPL
jgi:16S rRNA (cytosine967-C5)-methyltransferase